MLLLSDASAVLTSLLRTKKLLVAATTQCLHNDCYSPTWTEEFSLIHNSVSES